MGRYDKIRYWNGSAWVQPKEIRYWNGSNWISLGANDSSNTKALNIWKDNKWVRMTLNKTAHTTYLDKYLQYNGGTGAKLPYDYFFYNNGSGQQSKYEFIVTPEAQGNYMLMEYAISPSVNNKYYGRFGFYYTNSKYYVYGKTCSSVGSDKEVTTANHGSLAAGVKYRASFTCTAAGTGTVEVFNYSTGSTWTTSGSVPHGYWGITESTKATYIFGAYTMTTRNLYGKVYSAYLHGVGSTGSQIWHTSEYLLNNSVAGGTQIKATSGKGTDVTHHGTIVAPTTTYYTWE